MFSVAAYDKQNLLYYCLPHLQQSLGYPTHFYNRLIHLEIWTITFYSAIKRQINEIVMANTADPDQTAPKEQSDLGLQCLLRNSLQIVWVKSILLDLAPKV